MALIRLEQIAAPLKLTGTGLEITGDLLVASGSSTFYQQDPATPAVTIYGDTVIHDLPGISSASLTIDNIDTLGDETTPNEVDMGTF